MSHSDNKELIKSNSNNSLNLFLPTNGQTLDNYYFEIDRIAEVTADLNLCHNHKKPKRAQLKQSLTKIGKIRNFLENIRQNFYTSNL